MASWCAVEGTRTQVTGRWSCAQAGQECRAQIRCGRVPFHFQGRRLASSSTSCGQSHRKRECAFACRAMEQGSSTAERVSKWGKAFAWEIKGASVEQVWAVTGDFVGINKYWLQSAVQSCELVDGEPQKPGCVRKATMTSTSTPAPVIAEKLLEMDDLHHRYSYTILHTTLPGFSLMHDYVSTFKLSPLPDPVDEHDQGPGTLLHWSFTCSPVSSMPLQDALTTVLSLYQACIDELKTRLALPADDCVALF